MLSSIYPNGEENKIYGARISDFPGIMWTYRRQIPGAAKRTRNKHPEGKKQGKNKALKGKNKEKRTRAPRGQKRGKTKNYKTKIQKPKNPRTQGTSISWGKSIPRIHRLEIKESDKK